MAIGTADLTPRHPRRKDNPTGTLMHAESATDPTGPRQTRPDTPYPAQACEFPTVHTPNCWIL